MYSYKFKVTFVDIMALLMLVATISGIMACTSHINGYEITGEVENAAESDTVFLMEPVNNQLSLITKVGVNNGKFKITGEQDSTKFCFLILRQEGIDYSANFFLENGHIKAKFNADHNSSIHGTINNNLYQDFKDRVSAINARQLEIFEALKDQSISADQRAAYLVESGQKDQRIEEELKKTIKNNIHNTVGMFLYKLSYKNLTTAENVELLEMIPESYDNDEEIIAIKAIVEKQKATAEGMPFTDVELQDPQGKSVKLSDYVGKGKVVLVDFWASWCAPCRREMPALVELYAQYKNKNFEIVGISLDKSIEAWQESIKKLKITWPQMSDLKYWGNEAAKLYAIQSIPHTILIDANGTILSHNLHGKELTDKLAELLD